MVEDTELVSTLGEESQDLSAEEKEIKTLAEVPKYENVRAPGSDVKKGDLVLSKSDIIRGGGGEIGTLAFVGRQTVSFSYTLDISHLLLTKTPLGICNPQADGCFD